MHFGCCKYKPGQNVFDMVTKIISTVYCVRKCSAREMKGDAHHKKLHLKYRSNGSAVRLACAYCKRVGRSIVQNVSTCCKIERQIS